MGREGIGRIPPAGPFIDTTEHPRSLGRSYYFFDLQARLTPGVVAASFIDQVLRGFVDPRSTLSPGNITAMPCSEESHPSAPPTQSGRERSQRGGTRWQSPRLACGGCGRGPDETDRGAGPARRPINGGAQPIAHRWQRERDPIHLSSVCQDRERLSGDH